VQDLAARVERVTRQQMARTGQMPSERELAKELGASERSVQRVRSRPAAPSLSLEQPLDQANDMTFKDLVTDQAPPPDELLAQQRHRRELAVLLERLPALEAQVLRGRFGLGESDSVTLESLGTELELSRETVRQIHERALDRLRRGMKARAPSAEL
jgi:RNA polymerase primary sigma factor